MDEMRHLQSSNPEEAVAEEVEDEKEKKVLTVVEYSPHHRRRPSTFTRCGSIFHTSHIVHEAVEGTTTGASHRMSAGLPFSVSLKLAAPPAVSFIHLHCAQAMLLSALEHGYRGQFSLDAADAHHLLLYVVVPVEIEDMYAYEYLADYFVYTDDALRPTLADVLKPTLTRLPTFGDKTHCLGGAIGILAHGAGDDFAVACLQMTVERECEGSIISHLQEVAKLSVLQCSADRDEDNNWVVKTLAVPFDSKGDFEPYRWCSEISFAYAGKLYWADYNIGLICCDVFESSPKLQLVKFPVPVRKIRRGVPSPYDHCGQLESFRTAGVSNGKIKFVDVDNCRSQPFAVIIRAWTLQMPQMVWKLDDMLDVKDLWASASFKKYGLHQWVPQYPVVSLLDPHIVHFVLKEPRYHEQVWMIAVDMRAKSVKSCKNYPNGRKGDEYRGLLFNTRFICSELCK